MRWYIPSWNGDLRLEASDKKPKNETVLTIVSPTEAEKKILDAIQEEAVKQGWLYPSVRAERSGFLWRKRRVTLTAPIEVVGPIIARKYMRPNIATITAIAFTDGQMLVTEASALELQELLKTHPYREPPKDELAAKREEKKKEEPEPPKVEEKKPEPEKAVTVKRHTPCCPQCIPGAIGPASEVLLEFLSPEEHESWAKSRSLVVTGGLSGHRYLIAHRHSEIAQKVGRICFDLDDDCVVHFHDWTVPPEEEVLAAKLIMQHREPWLRNEATHFGNSNVRFKNPFGDGGDGMADASFAHQLGSQLTYALGAKTTHGKTLK